MPDKILFVDDSPLLCGMVKAALTELGYVVVTAHDGVQALQALEREKPDVLITDILMPQLDGLELIRRVRALPDTKRMPIIVVSSRGQPAQLVEGYRAGADDYVAKPFEMEVLVAKVEKLTRHLTELDQLRNLAETDPLTGLPNRRAVFAQFERLLASAKRYERPLSVIMLDLDGFKGYNDRLGHLMGDWLLRRVADAMVRTVRVSDMVARYGGDEFTVLAPDTSRAKSEHLLRRIVSAVGALGEISASGGVATYPEDGSAALEVFAAADDALYAAKCSSAAPRGSSFARLRLLTPANGGSAGPKAVVPARRKREVVSAASRAALSERPEKDLAT